jgi:hypothetical protein
VPNFAHRLKIISAIQQGMLQQSQVGGLTAQVGSTLNVGANAYGSTSTGAPGLGGNSSSSNNWRSPSDSLSGNTSSAWLPHGTH